MKFETIIIHVEANNTAPFTSAFFCQLFVCNHLKYLCKCKVISFEVFGARK